LMEKERSKRAAASHFRGRPFCGSDRWVGCGRRGPIGGARQNFGKKKAWSAGFRLARAYKRKGPMEFVRRRNLIQLIPIGQVAPFIGEGGFICVETFPVKAHSFGLNLNVLSGSGWDRSSSREENGQGGPTLKKGCRIGAIRRAQTYDDCRVAAHRAGAESWAHFIAEFVPGGWCFSRRNAIKGHHRHWGFPLQPTSRAFPLEILGWGGLGAGGCTTNGHRAPG